MRDELFKGDRVGRFCFDAHVAAVFDDMLARCIPFYPQVLELCGDMLLRLLPQSARLVDLGSSTGNLLLSIGLKAQRLGRRIELVGIDSSRDMIQQARLKAKAMGLNVKFELGDVLEADFGEADCFVCNYTLQFVAPEHRLGLVQKMYACLKQAGILLLSEKVRAQNACMHEAFTQQYYAYKQAQGYSLGEIEKKREALEDVLIPYSHTQNRGMLLEAGFREVETLFAWVNFETLIAMKGERHECY